ncbi:unnamed protein product, partial [Allacma fusca]
PQNGVLSPGSIPVMSYFFPGADQPSPDYFCLLR